MCSSKGLEDTKQVHARIIKTGLQMDASTTAGLINAYANCSEMADARLLFAKLPDQKLVSWNALMGGFVRNDQGEEAIKTFCKLHETGMVPNQSSFAIIVRASANLPSLEQGRQMHCLIIKTREDSDIFVGSSLVDMYAKCGNIDDARLVFDKMPERNVVSWNAIITGYAQHGHGSKVFHLFEEMQEEGLRPDEITFVGLLGACSHGGFVEKGHSFFESMQSDYNLKPGIEHYACMVDLLGRAGRLEEAENLIKRMPLEADSFIWQSFLGACRIHGNLQMGLSAAECLMKTHPENAATYVLLSHILAEGKRWSDVERVRKLMKERNVKKDPGCSWIELKGNVHSFVAWDVTHPNIKEIYAKLQELHRQISQAGYIPDTRFVLQDI